MRVEPLPLPFRIPAAKPVLSKAARASFRDRVSLVAGALSKDPESRAWAPDGRLDGEHLASSFHRVVEGGVARFNVADAGGYRGAPKCNLFALEVARRAGFRVPLVSRARGFGFPGADAIARAVARDEVGGWAVLADGRSLAELHADRSRGACLLLVGTAAGKAPGHLVVIDRILGIRRAPGGRIVRVRCVGWDASTGGARHRPTVMASTDVGGRFDRIHVLSLLPTAGAPEVLTGGRWPGPSRLDA